MSEENFKELFSAEGIVEDDDEGLESLRPTFKRGGVSDRSFESGRSPGPYRGDPPVTKGMSGEIASRKNSSRISIGMPVVGALEDVMSLGVPPAIRRQMEDFEFYPIEFFCSFRPGEGHTFTHATYELDFITSNPFDPGKEQPPAIAYSLFPDNIIDETEFSQKLSITPDLKFSAGPVEASLPLINVNRELSGKRYNARVYSFGWREETCGWTFNRNPSRDFSGSHSLYVLLRKRKQPGVQVKVVFRLSANVRAAGGLLEALQFKFRSKLSGAIEETPSYVLC